MKSVAGSELQAVTKGLGQDDAAGFVEGELGGHNGIMWWEKPIVNGIWLEMRKAGERTTSGTMVGFRSLTPDSQV
jgi:hypothetical protein